VISLKSNKDILNQLKTITIVKLFTVL